ncbi:transposase [Mangrovibacter phragmitis]|uniref:Transposase n=1 Tax=Mangrovibacter phragmitis TaxID=1691903 RepID=A0A1B7L9F5_9ENTR|nr:transposase [Mangrovibacter phragmitis]
MLLFTAPVVEPGFIQAEFTGGGSNTDAFSEFQGFIAEFGRVLFTGRFAG